MDIRSYMERQIKDYREAVQDDSTFSQGEADDELYLLFVRKLNQEKFSLLNAEKQPYRGISGNGENVNLTTIWNIVRKSPHPEWLTLVYQDKFIPLTNNLKDYERNGDFVRFVARSLNIPYQL